MDDKDPPPFGYTFSPDFFSTASNELENAGPSLLSDLESQQLTNFFSTAWADAPAFMPPSEHKDPPSDFVDWGSTFVPPATIHSVSTTIPDQTQLHHGFSNNGHSFAMPEPTQHNHSNNHAHNHHNHSQNHAHLFSTQDDLQAASTLFSHSQIPQTHHQPNGRSHSFHGIPSSSGALSGNTMSGGSMDSHHQSGTFNGMPLVPTQNGLIHEQLAALLPHHGSNGTIDAQIAAEFAASPAQERHEAELRELGLARPPLKRTYTYGTDSSFNETGFKVTKKEETEEHVTSRLMRQLQHVQPLSRPSANGTPLMSATGHMVFPPSSIVDAPSDEDDQSEDASDDDDSDKPRKRRKTRTAVKNGKRKSVSGAKGMAADDRRKKKRGSVAGQKAQRENLSEEQKRNNHILSEQKRRNLIKRGFDDLHDLVPEIRNGGLSKSGVLMEAGNFLDALLELNKQLRDMLALGGDKG